MLLGGIQRGKYCENSGVALGAESLQSMAGMGDSSVWGGLRGPESPTTVLLINKTIEDSGVKA